MADSWEAQYRKGIWLPRLGWWLDAQSRQQRAIVSHAHSDHIARHARILCSPPTARLLRARLPGKREIETLPFGRTVPLDSGTDVTLYPAGHILGSSMIRLTGAGGSLLYTGDFKLQPGLAAEPCQPVPADVLIMETTFGLPRHVFPPQEEVVKAMQEFCGQALAEGHTPVLYCYTLGKTQEVLKALGPANLPVMLHPAAFRLTGVYEQCGMTFPAYREFEPRDCAGHVVICPPPRQRHGLLRHLPSPRTAVVTGWAVEPGALYRYQCHAAFPLSDHAGFDDLIRLVEIVQPGRILTVHGFAAEFASTLRRRGWNASALGKPDQLDLPFGTAGTCLEVASLRKSGG